MQYLASYSSPIGMLRLIASEEGISNVDFAEADPVYGNFGNEILESCIKQLDEYFSGDRKMFSLPLDLEGTDFQKSVWSRLCDIPYGATASYGKVAESIGNSNASRAVGNANNKNPIPIIVPCHRVVGAGNSLVGYAGGLWRKEWLLIHEARMAWILVLHICSIAAIACN